MTTTSQEFQKLVFCLAKRMKSDLEAKLISSKAGVTLAQYVVLKKLSKDSSTLQELAETLGVRPPSLVGVVDAMEKLKLLTRKADVSDRRKSHLLISPKGKKLLARIPFQDGSDAVRKALDSLGDKKKEQLVKLLREVTEYLEA